MQKASSEFIMHSLQGIVAYHGRPYALMTAFGIAKAYALMTAFGIAKVSFFLAL
jgi:hypothetical protein